VSTFEVVAQPPSAVALLSYPRPSAFISGETVLLFPMSAMSGSPESPLLAFWGGMSRDGGVIVSVVGFPFAITRSPDHPITRSPDHPITRSNCPTGCPQSFS
jgi:hypothetical protein